MGANPTMSHARAPAKQTWTTGGSRENSTAQRMFAHAHPSLAAALESYERQILARMELAIEETIASQHMLLSVDAPDGLGAMIVAEEEAASD